MRLTTKRLILRDITKKDAKDLVRNINNLNVSRNLAAVPYPYTMKDAKWYIKKQLKEIKEKSRKGYIFVIELKSKKGLIGAVGLHKVDKFNGTATMGYWLGQNYWRQGIMYEAACKVLDFAFKNLKLRRIDIGAWTKNEKSNGLIKKLGFKKEGFRRKAIKVKADGIVRDEFIYGMLRNEWKTAEN